MFLTIQLKLIVLKGLFTIQFNSFNCLLYLNKDYLFIYILINVILIVGLITAVFFMLFFMQNYTK